MPTKKRRPKIGLALSGGGARGLAHIGVIKVLLESGVPIDFISGASMGGLIAGMYCAGIPIHKLESIALDFSKPNQLIKMIDFSPPRRGLLNGERVKEVLQEMIGRDCPIERLSTPLALSSVDLRKNQAVCIDTGSLLEGMMATVAIPGLFDPVAIDDRLLVDGGVLNNLPVDLVQEMGADITIAVDVNYFYDFELSWDEKFVAARLNSMLPSVFLDVYQTEMIMISAITEYQLKENRPDFLLRPAIPVNVNIFIGFAYADQIIAAGEEVARSHLDQILSRINQS